MKGDEATLSRPLLGTLVVVAIAAGVVIGIRQPTQSTPATKPTTCAPRSEQEYTANADLIIVGRVFAVVPGPTGADVLLTVDETLQGTVPASGVTIAAKAVRPDGQTSTTDGELHFQSGETRYLLFLLQRADGRFTTSACGGSRVLDQQSTTSSSSVL